MGFDVRSACAGTESTHFILDKKFSYKRFAETRSSLEEVYFEHTSTYVEI